MDYMKYYTDAYGINKFFPIFAESNTQFDGQTYKSIVVSTDSVRDYYYRVVFDEDPPTVIDRRRSSVSFPHSTDATALSFAEMPKSGGDKVTTIEFSPTELMNYKNPTTYKEAISRRDGKEWIKAVDKEMDQMIEMDVMEPVESVPPGKKAIGSKLVYKLKLIDAGGYPKIDKYKGRLVGLGYQEKYGIDYIENFSPTPQITSVRFLLNLILQNKWNKYHCDVKGAFLNSTLKEELFLKLPTGFKVKGCEYVKLKKSLYGLKQAARDWYDTNYASLIKCDPRIVRSKVDPCIFYINEPDIQMVMVCHVDDYIIGCSDPKWFPKFLKTFNEHFPMNLVGEPQQYLGMKSNGMRKMKQSVSHRQNVSTK